MKARVCVFHWSFGSLAPAGRRPGTPGLVWPGTPGIPVGGEVWGRGPGAQAVRDKASRVSAALQQWTTRKAYAAGVRAGGRLGNRYDQKPHSAAWKRQTVTRKMCAVTGRAARFRWAAESGGARARACS